MHVSYLAKIIDTVFINLVIITYYICELVSDGNIHSELWHIPTSAYIAKQVFPSPPPWVRGSGFTTNVKIKIKIVCIYGIFKQEITSLYGLKADKPGGMLEEDKKLKNSEITSCRRLIYEFFEWYIPSRSSCP